MLANTDASAGENMGYEKKHKRRSKRRRKKEEAAEAGSETRLTPGEAGRQVYPAPEPPTIHSVEEHPRAPSEQKEPLPEPAPAPGAQQQEQPRPLSKKRRKEKQAANAPEEKGRGEPERRTTTPPPPVNGVGSRPGAAVPPAVEKAGRRKVAAPPPETPETGESERPQGPASPEAATQQTPGFQGYGQYPPQPYWYPPVYPPAAFYGYPPGYQQGPPVETGGGHPPDEQTGPIPVVPPQPVQPMPPYLYPPAFLPLGGDVRGLPSAPLMPPFQPIENIGFEELTRAESTHWRVDMKWVFGILTTLLLFLVLTTAGLYRISGRGAAQEIAVPVIDIATSARSAVEENYQDLKAKARKKKNAQIMIPDVGVDISVEAETITSLGSEELADSVILEIERQLYNQGYYGDLPMKPAQGVGEERGKATCETFLASLNRKTHQVLVWPLIILGSMALLFAVPFLIFCRGWGKMIGAGVIVVAAALPASIYIRIGCRFLWKGTAAGLYKGVVLQTFRDSGSLMLVYFDIALGVGALLLLVGIVGNLISRKSIERVPPFEDLLEPEEIVVGGPPVGGPTPPEVDAGGPAGGSNEDAFLD
ncbi:MAG: hypothetical protein KJ686_12645 [Actinobacteria bacterium]|nr:hypothetical protein [Actinomycetota bacterium]